MQPCQCKAAELGPRGSRHPLRWSAATRSKPIGIVVIVVGWVDVVRGHAELADGGRVVHPTYTSLYDWDDFNK